jgi:hypothetical protein
MSDTPRRDPRNFKKERPAEPGQRFITVEAWQKDEFQEALLAKVKELGLVQEQDVILRMDPVNRKEPSEGQYLAKVTFTARMGNKRSSIMELHDVMDRYDQRDIPLSPP